MSYIQSFAKEFYDQVKKLIDKNQQNNITELGSSLNKADLELGLELLDHAYFCIETAEKFHGRIDLLAQVILRLFITFLSLSCFD